MRLVTFRIGNRPPAPRRAGGRGPAPWSLPAESPIESHWKFEDCIAHVSRSETLHPGEFFGSGTVGNGCGLEHMKFLKPGDVVELAVERIGVLRNRVVR